MHGGLGWSEREALDAHVARCAACAAQRRWRRAVAVELDIDFDCAAQQSRAAALSKYIIARRCRGELGNAGASAPDERSAILPGRSRRAGIVLALVAGVLIGAGA